MAGLIIIAYLVVRSCVLSLVACARLLGWTLAIAYQFGCWLAERADR